MSDQIKDLLNAMGALSEVCWVFYQDLLKQGFDEKQALYLASVLIKASTSQRNTEDDVSD